MVSYFLARFIFLEWKVGECGQDGRTCKYCVMYPLTISVTSAEKFSINALVKSDAACRLVSLSVERQLRLPSWQCSIPAECTRHWGEWLTSGRFEISVDILRRIILKQLFLQLCQCQLLLLGYHRPDCGNSPLKPILGRIIFSQNSLNVSGDANMSLCVPILTTTDKNLSARETSCSVNLPSWSRSTGTSQS